MVGRCLDPRRCQVSGSVCEKDATVGCPRLKEGNPHGLLAQPAWKDQRFGSRRARCGASPRLACGASASGWPRPCVRTQTASRRSRGCDGLRRPLPQSGSRSASARRDRARGAHPGERSPHRHTVAIGRPQLDEQHRRLVAWRGSPRAACRATAHVERRQRARALERLASPGHAHSPFQAALACFEVRVGGGVSRDADQDGPLASRFG